MSDDNMSGRKRPEKNSQSSSKNVPLSQKQLQQLMYGGLPKKVFKKKAAVTAEKNQLVGGGFELGEHIQHTQEELLLIEPKPIEVYGFDETIGLRQANIVKIKHERARREEELNLAFQHDVEETQLLEQISTVLQPFEAINISSSEEEPDDETLTDETGNTRENATSSRSIRDEDWHFESGVQLSVIDEETPKDVVKLKEDLPESHYFDDSCDEDEEVKDDEQEPMVIHERSYESFSSYDQNEQSEDEENRGEHEDDEEDNAKKYEKFVKATQTIKETYGGSYIPAGGRGKPYLNTYARRENNRFQQKREKDFLSKVSWPPRVARPIDRATAEDETILYQCPYEVRTITNCRTPQYEDYLQPRSSKLTDNLPPPPWPTVLLTYHKSPLSSRDISTFLFREENDQFFYVDKVGNILLKRVKMICDKLAANNVTVDDCFPSLQVNFDSFPSMLCLRESDDRLLRPIIIDGCAVAYSYDDEFLPKWDRESVSNIYMRKRVLPVYPLVTLALRVILMGHKVKIVLPDYYKIPYFKQQRQLKVDNLYAFKKLESLGLLKFISIRDMDYHTNYALTIKEITNKIGACLLSNSDVAADYRGNGEPLENEDDVTFEQLPPILGKGINANTLKIERITKISGERILNVLFHSASNDMTICQEYYDYVGIDTEHEKRKYLYHRIDRDITFFYTNFDGDVADEEVKLRNQLILKHQVHQVIELADLYPLTTYHLRSVQMFLYFAKSQNIRLEEFNKFVEEHPPYDVMDIAQLGNPSDEEEKEESSENTKDDKHFLEEDEDVVEVLFKMTET